MILRPLGVWMEGQLHQGFEVEIELNQPWPRILAVRSSTHAPDPFILSPAFVNAHSHLEYRGLLGKIQADDYWGWIRELTRIKASQDLESVRCDCQVAANENVRSGVGLIAEHSDRPYAAEAMKQAGLQGRIYQELITFAELVNPQMKRIAVEAKRAQQASLAGAEVVASPHSAYTVDEESLSSFRTGKHFSIHVAETPLEDQFFLHGKGPIAELYSNCGFKVRNVQKSVVTYLDSLGLCRPGAQFVHCCSIHSAEVGLLAERGVSVAHCPRSNQALRCPPAPVRRLWDAGCLVGIGMDSAASSGPIDFLAEMRAVLQVSRERREPLTAEMTWQMATTMGAKSIGFEAWDIRPGSTIPLIQIRTESADLEEVLVNSSIEDVQWVSEIRSQNFGSL